MSRNWTSDQKTAIEARNGSLLLSAAAGSGKTAVLVERVLQRLTDPQKPCTPDGLLVVTFTNAAAAEMKQKIISEVASLAMKNPWRPDLIRLQIQIQNANICTMDTFCIRLVRENAAILGVEPDFRIAEGSEITLMRSKAMGQTVNALHDSEDESLMPMLEMFYKGGRDFLLTKSIESLYDNACSYPFPDLWLEELSDMYLCTKTLAENIWGRAILEKVSSVLAYASSLTKDAAKLLEEGRFTEAELYEKIYPNIEILEYNIAECEKFIEEKDWDGLLHFSSNMSFNTMRPGPKSPLKDELGKKHNEAVKQLKNIPSLLCATEDEHKEDMKLLYPIAKGLVYAVQLFTENFKKLKAEANVLDFSDSLHYALSLLYTHENEKLIRTDFAKELSEQFEEVLIDEYQDTNEAQDLLFRGLSKSEQNLFMVGDVKQSIYGFRLANPNIFMKYSDNMPLYKDENYPAKVILGKNFRSRAGVLNAVNFIFSQIMSRKAGTVHYSESEKLYCGRSDTESSSPDTEIHFLDLESSDSEEALAEIEARHLAALIKNMVESEVIIETNKGEKRPVRYGDFCILFRSTANSANVYSNILQEHKIPVQGENSRNFFESREISTFLSLLKVIDNPLSDVELLSLLLSPIYAFTPDEIAALRIKNRNASLYELLSLEKNKGNEKISSLLFDLQKYRSLSSFGTAADFIRKLISETKYMSFLSAMEESEKRKANINLLISYAESYDSRGTTGLAGFLRYLEMLHRTEQEFGAKKLGSASLPSDMGNSVSIMTIHKSKGLEFPIVILANTVKGFNTQDTHNNLLIHSKLGIGIQVHKPEEFKKYPSIAHSAIKYQMLDDLKSEEMRILYVALTRAREKLIILVTEKNIDKRINDLCPLITFEDEKISPRFVLEQNNFARWLLITSLRHPSAGKILRERLQANSYLGEDFLIKNAAPIDIRLSDPEEYIEPAQEQEEVITSEDMKEYQEEEAALLSILSERMNYEYPYEALQSLSSKYAASSLAKIAEDSEFYALSKPSFLQSPIKSGAEAGTAAHNFLQYCDFALAAKNVEAEILRLQTQKRLSPEQAKAIRPKQIHAFLNSPLFTRIMASEQVYREKQFSISLPAYEIDSSLPAALANEPIFVQGIADLIFIEDGECVIVDYKTDRVKQAEDLTERYFDQLRIYKKTAEKVFGLKVKESIIYSLSLNKSVSIDFNEKSV